MARCPECEGSGEVRRVTGGWGPNVETFTCPHCGGTGEK